MDAVEFVKAIQRETTMKGRDYRLIRTGCDPEKLVSFYEQWAKEHPIKTRQSVFLEQWPEATIYNGVLNISPCNIDQSVYDIQKCNGSNCNTCRREFWMQEVE